MMVEISVASWDSKYSMEKWRRTDLEWGVVGLELGRGWGMQTRGEIGLVGGQIKLAGGRVVI